MVKHQKKRIEALDTTAIETARKHGNELQKLQAQCIAKQQDLDRLRYNYDLSNAECNKTVVTLQQTRIITGLQSVVYVFC